MITMSSAPTFMVYADVKNGNALETLYKNKQSLGLKRGEDILELGKDEYVYKTKSMNIFYGIKDKTNVCERMMSYSTKMSAKQ